VSNETEKVDSIRPILPISEYWLNKYQRDATTTSKDDELPETARVLDDGRSALLRDGTRLRVTPAGQPMVDELVRAGDLIVASWLLPKDEEEADEKKAVDEEAFEKRVVKVQSHLEYGLRVYDLIYARLDAPRTRTGKLRILDLEIANELVAQDGRILAFFEANEDEVFVKKSRVLVFA
jgi:hypothetical protein